MGKRLTNDIYIDRSNIVHNNFYNYDLVDYKNNDSNVVIICPIHGSFSQLAKSHLNGHGCPKCAYNILTNDEYVKKCEIIHNYRYGYDGTFLEKYSKKVEVYCYIHGKFEQIAKLHLNGHGCPKCANGVYTKTAIIDKANILHNYKYKYYDFDFDKRMSETILKINCPNHGDFFQRLNNHIHQLNGCPNCRESKGENYISMFLTKNNIIYERQKRFDGCKNKKTLSFDFYLIECNTCIEFDGEQHFEPIYGLDTLENLKFNDNIKNNFCKDNNISLIRIKYDEDIEEKLSFLKN